MQKPRIPIWVVGAWPRSKSMQRALRYDGLLPQVLTEDGKPSQATPDDLRQIGTHITANRPVTDPYDIIVEGTTDGDDPVKAANTVRPWMNAGATWWIEALWEANEKPNGFNLVRKRLLEGPPRL